MSQCLPFLLNNPDEWPMKLVANQLEVASELSQATFCGFISTKTILTSPGVKFPDSRTELLQITVQELHGADNPQNFPSAKYYGDANDFDLQLEGKASQRSCIFWKLGNQGHLVHRTGWDRIAHPHWGKVLPSRTPQACHYAPNRPGSNSYDNHSPDQRFIIIIK